MVPPGWMPRQQVVLASAFLIQDFLVLTLRTAFLDCVSLPNVLSMPMELPRVFFRSNIDVGDLFLVWYWGTVVENWVKHGVTVTAGQALLGMGSLSSRSSPWPSVVTGRWVCLSCFAFWQFQMPLGKSGYPGSVGVDPQGHPTDWALSPTVPALPSHLCRPLPYRSTKGHLESCPLWSFHQQHLTLDECSAFRCSLNCFTLQTGCWGRRGWVAYLLVGYICFQIPEEISSRKVKGE